MKTYLDCLPCMINQALRTGRIATDNEEIIKEILDKVGCSIKNVPMNNTPAQTGAIVYHIVKELTGVVDPYKQIKADSIAEAYNLYPVLESYIRNSDDKLLSAIRIAIAGNVVDFGISKKYNLESELHKIMNQKFGVFDYDIFKNNLDVAKSVLFIGDNAGESVFDRILIEQLGVPVTYVVRGIPIINDVTVKDAIDSGIDKVSEIISSGTTAPGTILELCTDDFVEKFENADMIISKGQGNYEGLSNVNRQVFFLLKAKCYIIAKHLKVAEDDIVLKALQV